MAGGATQTSHLYVLSGDRQAGRQAETERQRDRETDTKRGKERQR